MVEVATVTCFWNSLEGLKKQIPSIHGRFKGHVFIDGVYKEWPLSPEERKFNGLSTDGSREYIKSFQDPIAMNIVLLDAPYKTEHEKRSMYLDPELLLRRLDVDAILILDSDEYVDCNTAQWEYFYDQIEHICLRQHKESWNVYGIDLADVGQRFESFQGHPRLWFKPWNMMYKPGSHYQFINNKRELNHLNDNYSQYPYVTIKGIRIWHDDSWKNPVYLQKKNEYELWLTEHEQKLSNLRL